ncbi:MAG: hypothetical protein N4Q18_00980 [Lactobacillus crispatus]|uniref:hypothetical protein n=1 Tax=Lactobacillus crispatus TaxID=47770 RepID=UPI000DFB6E3A|nr:hypothetical protein [Lactobacillus crispatus]STX18435.1 Uncharacterised protein [Lactobacillus acidophilus]MCT7807855.1 hypothetical protein [Lactobacillus crispatus]MCT7816369.1 hypothetical protein [Lactobacillus crispatus]MCT7869619.1 hypothetical protein [Lactobacillus crispatus]
MEEQLVLFKFDRTEHKDIDFSKSIVYKKFGLAKLNNIKTLNTAPTDKLWDTFRKTAYFIYQNREWTWSDCLNAATYLYPFLGFEQNSQCKYPLDKLWAKSSESVDKVKIQKLGLLAGRYSTYNYVIHIILNEYDGRTHYLVLTDDRIKLANSGTIYNYRGTRYDFTYISKGMLLGFSKLVENLIENYRKDNHGINQRTFFKTIEGLLSGKRSLSYMSLEHFVEDTSWITDKAFSLAKTFAENTGHSFDGFNDGIKTKDFVRAYLSKNYSEILMQKHENNMIVITRTERWRKHTNLQAPLINAMYRSPLQKDFLDLQIDDDVNVSIFHQAEKAIEGWLKVLPKLNVKPVLRFKNLPKKQGLYLSESNQIILDLRSKPLSSAKSESGINYFVHEYGHFIDYQYSHEPLSMLGDFNKIWQSVGSYVVKKMKIKNQSNLLIPTEVFARCFELYLFNAMQDTSLKLLRKYYELPEYVAIRKSTMSEVIDYFDRLFPTWKRALKKTKHNKISA